ncbi:hypothetical protein [Enterococcus sp. AZ196]|uniref:hypothetical protein n=1 Tax=Enterococcus sp. AZ196 TaxID=2774659 RepID=UPI003D2A9D05
MNDEDLHDILEKIDEKEKAAAGMRDLAKSLGVFKESLLLEGFDEMEAMSLVATLMVTMIGSTMK